LHEVGQPVHHVVLIAGLEGVCKALQPADQPVGHVADQIDRILNLTVHT